MDLECGLGQTAQSMKVSGKKPRKMGEAERNLLMENGSLEIISEA